MCVVAAELWLLVLHAAAELYCVLYDAPHSEKQMLRKASRLVVVRGHPGNIHGFPIEIRILG